MRLLALTQQFNVVCHFIDTDWLSNPSPNTLPFYFVNVWILFCHLLYVVFIILDCCVLYTLFEQFVYIVTGASEAPRLWHESFIAICIELHVALTLFCYQHSLYSHHSVYVIYRHGCMYNCCVIVWPWPTYTYYIIPCLLVI